MAPQPNIFALGQEFARRPLPPEDVAAVEALAHTPDPATLTALVQHTHVIERLRLAHATGAAAPSSSPHLPPSLHDWWPLIVARVLALAEADDRRWLPALLALWRATHPADPALVPPTLPRCEAALDAAVTDRVARCSS